MLESHNPTFLWPEVVATATYLLNRLPTKTLNFRTPLQTLSAHSHLPPALTLSPRIFGCSVFVHVPNTERTKFDPCAIKCVFVGYGFHQKGYRCYHPPTRRIFTTMDCDFLETEYFYTAQPSVPGEESTTPDPLDPLSWLCIPDLPDTISNNEQNGLLTGHLTNNEEPIELADSCPASPHPDTPEVNFAPETIPALTTTDSENAAEDVAPETEVDEPVTQRYSLPPWSTRGVPPKQYSPEYKPRSSRYPIDNPIRGSLSGMAKAFTAAVYSEEIPRTIQEAQQKKE